MTGRHVFPARRANVDLSARELDVLREVAEGRSNLEVGEALGLSSLTIKSHLSRMGRKLGCGDRAGMVGIGFREQLLAWVRLPDGRWVVVTRRVRRGEAA